MTTISKTQITFTVLHATDEPLNESIGNDDGPFDNVLGEAIARSWDGNGVGQITSVTTVEVPDEQVADALVELGNDGTFFDFELDEADSDEADTTL